MQRAMMERASSLMFSPPSTMLALMSAVRVSILVATCMVWLWLEPWESSSGFRNALASGESTVQVPPNSTATLPYSFAGSAMMTSSSG